MDIIDQISGCGRVRVDLKDHGVGCIRTGRICRQMQRQGDTAGGEVIRAGCVHRVQDFIVIESSGPGSGPGQISIVLSIGPGHLVGETLADHVVRARRSERYPTDAEFHRIGYIRTGRTPGNVKNKINAAGGNIILAGNINWIKDSRVAEGSRAGGGPVIAGIISYGCMAEIVCGCLTDRGILAGISHRGGHQGQHPGINGRTAWFRSGYSQCQCDITAQDIRRTGCINGVQNMWVAECSRSGSAPFQCVVVCRNGTRNLKESIRADSGIRSGIGGSAGDNVKDHRVENGIARGVAVSSQGQHHIADLSMGRGEGRGQGGFICQSSQSRVP